MSTVFQYDNEVKAIRIIESLGIKRKSRPKTWKQFKAIALQLIEDGYLDRYVMFKVQEVMMFKQNELRLLQETIEEGERRKSEKAFWAMKL